MGRKKLYKKNTNIFEIKNFSYIKAFFNNIDSNDDIKATSEVTKIVLVSIVKLYIKVCFHSFAQDVVQKNKSKSKKGVRTSTVKGIKTSNDNKTRYKCAVIKCFFNVLFNTK